MKEALTEAIAYIEGRYLTNHSNSCRAMDEVPRSCNCGAAEAIEVINKARRALREEWLTRDAFRESVSANS